MVASRVPSLPNMTVGSTCPQRALTFGSDSTIDWKLASNQAASVLNPYYSTTTVPFADAQMTLSLHTSWSPPTKVDMPVAAGLVPPTLKAMGGVVICSCI